MEAIDELISAADFLRRRARMNERSRRDIASRCADRPD